MTLELETASAKAMHGRKKFERRPCGACGCELLFYTMEEHQRCGRPSNYI